MAFLYSIAGLRQNDTFKRLGVREAPFCWPFLARARGGGLNRHGRSPENVHDRDGFCRQVFCPTGPRKATTSQGCRYMCSTGKPLFFPGTGLNGRTRACKRVIFSLASSCSRGGVFPPQFLHTLRLRHFSVRLGAHAKGLWLTIRCPSSLERSPAATT